MAYGTHGFQGGSWSRRLRQKYADSLFCDALGTKFAARKKKLSAVKARV